MKTIYFDTETYKEINQELKEQIYKPYLIGWMYDGQYQYCDINNINNFIEDIAKIIKVEDITMVAYNALFDIMVILPMLKEKWPDKFAAQLDKNKKFIKGSYKVGKRVIKFVDLWMWDKSKSLSDYAKELEGRGKETIDYDKNDLFKISQKKIYYFNSEGQIKSTDLSKELRYLKRDVTLLPKVDKYINDLKEEAVKSLNLKSSILKDLRSRTSAGFAKFIISKACGIDFDKRLRPMISKEMYDLHVRSFQGGYTAGSNDFRKIKFDKPLINSYDYNSMYPSIMVERVPVGHFKKEGKEGDIAWYFIKTKDPIFKKEYAHIDTMIMKEELRDGKVWFCEERLFKVMCKVLETPIEVVKIQYTESTNCISGVLYNMYNRRKEAKKEGKKLEETTLKIIMNSIYGKSCEKAHILGWVYNKGVFVKAVAMNPKYHSLLMGIYVTNQGRSRMFETIVTVTERGNQFYYCDTDSVTFMKSHNHGLDVGDRLGQLKWEGSFDYMARPESRKKYLMINHSERKIKFAISGFDRDTVQELDEEQLKILFDPETNVLWKKGRNASWRNSIGQIIIQQVDIMTNNKIEVTHEIVHENGTPKIIPYVQKTTI